MQLANAGYQAFRVADNNMYEINLKVARVPSLMGDLVMTFSQTNGPIVSC